MQIKLSGTATEDEIYNLVIELLSMPGGEQFVTTTFAEHRKRSVLRFSKKYNKNEVRKRIYDWLRLHINH
jgi:hypothetical protein